jgi:hypothetical protein
LEKTGRVASEQTSSVNNRRARVYQLTPGQAISAPADR